MPSSKATLKAKRAAKKGALPLRKTNLAAPIYHHDDAARAHLESLLWPNGPVCPRCHASEGRVTKMAGKSTRPGLYKCKDCRKPFTVTIGTIMERSHIPLHKWVLAAHFMSAHKKGMSALQLQRDLGTNYETAWFLFHRLRECAAGLASGPIGGEGMTIEVDETYIGGREPTNMPGSVCRAIWPWTPRSPSSPLSSATAAPARTMSPASRPRPFATPS